MSSGVGQPELLSIVVCDEIIVDKTTNKTTLVGLFNKIGAARFPCTHANLHVFVSLTNGHGKAEGELCWVQRGEEKKLGGIKGTIAFPSPLAVVDMNFELSRIVFPKAGRYSFDFYCNGELVGSRPFDVALQQPRGRPGRKPA